MNDLLPDSIADSLPGWIIERAAAYMLRRYGRGAIMRAAARHRLLLDQGKHASAADWRRVADEIERLENALAGRARRRKPAPDVARSGH